MLKSYETCWRRIWYPPSVPDPVQIINICICICIYNWICICFCICIRIVFFICIYCLYFYLYFYLYLYLKLFMINLRFGVLSLALLSSRQWWSGSPTSFIVCFTQPCRSPYHLVSSAEPQSSHQTTVLNNLENANTLYLYLYVFLSLFLHLYLQNLKAHSRHRSLTFWEGKHREWEMNRE